jgi:hypothetical protein
VKSNVKQTKKKAKDWKKILTKHIYDKGLVSMFYKEYKIYKEFLRCSRKKIQLKIRQKILNSQSIEEMAIKQMKRSSTSLRSGKCK